MKTEWDRLGSMSKAEQIALQNDKLKYLAKHVLPFHPFYREHFKKHNIQFSDLRTVADLRRIPLISKEDLVPTDEVPDKPRQFILQPDEATVKKYHPKMKLINGLLGRNLHQRLEYEFKPIHIHFTTGRSAAQIPFLYSLYDLERLGQAGHRLFTTAGLGGDDIAVNAFPFAPHLAFWQVQKAIEAVDIRCLHTGGGKIMGTEKILNAVEKMGATVLVVMPGYGYHLFKQAVRDGRDFSKLRTVIFGGERVSAGLRKKVTAQYPGLRIMSTYAFTEAKTAWVQCHEESGYHLYPDMEYIELVNEAGEPVVEGEPGEVVYTSLNWRGSMVMRYRTGDICEGMSYEPCEHCGRTVPRLHYDIQRKSEFKELQLSKVKGELVNLNAFYHVLHGLEEIDEWQVEIGKRDNDPYEVDELIVRIACVHGESCDRCDHLVEQRVHDVVGVGAKIFSHTREDMVERLGMEKELKEKRIVDRR